jgi:hypothetical protein
VTLTKTGGNHWAGAGPLGGATVSSINYFIQAVDLAGNVGLSVHKVLAASVVLPPATGAHLTITPAGTQVATGWFGSAPTVTIAADSGYLLSYSVDGGPVTAYNNTPFLVQGNGIHVVDAFADNAAGDHFQVSAAVAIDTGPTITILSPLDGSLVFTGDTVLYSCADPAVGIAAPDGCVGTLPNGSVITTTSGSTTKTLTVNAKDTLGRRSTKTITYQVWPWTGFLSPIDNPPMINVVNAGNTIPIKFSLGGNRGLNLFAPGYPASQAMVCPSSAPQHTIDPTISTSANGLTYDSKANQYNYGWKTQTSWSGTCRQLTLLFTNGAVRTALFQFK